MEYNFDDQELRTRWWIPITVVVVIVVVAAGYVTWRALRHTVPTKETTAPPKLPRMTNLPPKEEASQTIPPPYSPDAPLLEQVREAMRKNIDAERAVALAKSLPQQPERADAAFILLEYAAEAGHGEAAFIVAQYFDPTSADDCGTIIKDPAAAYEWYQVALSKGQPEAQKHISDLRQWVQKEAAHGSVEARDVLTNWQ